MIRKLHKRNIDERVRISLAGKNSSNLSVRQTSSEAISQFTVSPRRIGGVFYNKSPEKKPQEAFSPRIKSGKVSHF